MMSAPLDDEMGHGMFYQASYYISIVYVGNVCIMWIDTMNIMINKQELKKSDDTTALYA